jgi:hypothetical protein
MLARDERTWSVSRRPFDAATRRRTDMPARVELKPFERGAKSSGGTAFAKELAS